MTKYENVSRECPPKQFLIYEERGGIQLHFLLLVSAPKRRKPRRKVNTSRVALFYGLSNPPPHQSKSIPESELHTSRRGDLVNLSLPVSFILYPVSIGKPIS